jgi:Ni,Fe-hydrogenase III large subunit
MGMPEQEAIQMIQEIMQEIQNGETGQEAPEQEQPMMKDGGEYLEALKGKKIKNYTYNKNTGNYDVEIE